MNERLSSSLTYVFKFYFPTMWLGGSSIGTIFLLIDRDWAALPMALVTAFGIVFIGFGCFPLKQVIATDDGLLVSNFSEEVRVSYSEVLEIMEGRTREVVIVLRNPCRFGTRIKFIPEVRYRQAPYNDRPGVADFLRSRPGK